MRRRSLDHGLAAAPGRPAASSCLFLQGLPPCWMSRFVSVGDIKATGARQVDHEPARDISVNIEALRPGGALSPAGGVAILNDLYLARPALPGPCRNARYRSTVATTLFVRLRDTVLTTWLIAHPD